MKKSIFLIMMIVLTACAEPSVPPSGTSEPTATPEQRISELPGGGFTYILPDGYLINPSVGPEGVEAGDERSILLGKEGVTDLGPLVRVGGGVLQEPFSAEALLSTYRDYYGNQYGLILSETESLLTANGLSGTRFTFETTLGVEDGTGQVTILSSDDQFVTLVAIANHQAWAGEFSAEVSALIDSIALIEVQPIIPDVATTALVNETSIIPQAYSLGWTTLTLPDEVKAKVSKTLWSRPAKVEGIIAIPEGSGTHPVALVLHGRFGQEICRPMSGSISSPAQAIVTFCLPGGAESRFDVGHANLVGALAEEGYVALAINLNDTYDIFSVEGTASGIDLNNIGDYFIPQLVQLHLDALANNALPIDLAGRVDLSQPPLLLGHSRGGELILNLAKKMPVSGLVLFGAPGDGGLSAPADVPLGIVYGECDGDVYYWDSQRYFEEAENDPNRTAFASAIMLDKANHNFFNGLLGMNDDGGNKIGNPNCFAEDGGLSQEAQQAFMISYVRDFVAMLHGSHPFSVEQPAPAQLYGQPIVANLTTAAKQILLNNEGVSEEASEGLSITSCEAKEICHPTFVNLDQFGVPGEPIMKRLTWEQPAVSYTLTFSPIDATMYDALNIRTVLDPSSDLNGGSATISFTVRLVDAEGNSGTFTANTTPLLYTEPDEFYGFGGMPILAGADRFQLKS
ncbi:MAG: Alpha/beta hydrolase family protein [Chloroflexi bacterium OLB14]|nr:MAG: Alpha/beta hydrolase family protein [Chloroflexi bacterium OLB14]